MSTGSGGVDFEEVYRRLDEAERRLTRGLDVEARDDLLRRRAQEIGGRVERVAVETVPVLGFKLAEERYGLRVSEVDQVVPARNLSPLAGTPRHVLGAVVVRSRVVPVLDLRHLLGLAGRSASDLTTVLSVSVGEERFGVAVEEVEGQLELPKSQLERPESGPFHYIGADRRAIIDLARLLELSAGEARS